MEPPKLSDLPSSRSSHPPHLRESPRSRPVQPIQDSLEVVGLAQSHVRLSRMEEDLRRRLKPLGERLLALQDARFVPRLGFG